MSFRRDRPIATFAAIALLVFPAWLIARSADPLKTSIDAESPSHDDTIDPARELVITDPSVIASPLETTFDPQHPSGNAAQGAWTFGRLIHNMLPAAQRRSPAAASALVMRWLKTWEVPQSPNPSVSAAPARPAVRLQILNPWKAVSGCPFPESPRTDAECVLDMSKAPFRLMAIVNRPDLRIVANDETAIGGEGRFVFQVLGPTLGLNKTTDVIAVMDPAIKAQKFTVAFEYTLPVWGNGERDTLAWARAWHRLGRTSFGRDYNAVLRGLTDAFSGADADPRRINGNAINQIRTNEAALMGALFPIDTDVWKSGKLFWELREFRLASAGLVPHTVNREPSRDFDIRRPGQTGSEGTRTGELTAFLLANGPAVRASSHSLPPEMLGNSSLMGIAPYGAWGKLTNAATRGTENQMGVDVEARDSFAMNTCAGCHRHETSTPHFMHITALGAMDPVSKSSDRASAGVLPGTSEETIVLSNALRNDITPGGSRFEDFRALLERAQ